MRGFNRTQANEVRALFENVKQIEESSDFIFAALLSFSKQLKSKMGQPEIKDFETEKLKWVELIEIRYFS